MTPLGLTHILMTLAAYLMYFFIAIKFLSKSYPYRLLTISNVLYVSGFVLGMVWAQVDWGYPVSLDSKILISALVPIPFIIENIRRKKDWRLPAIGCALIILNYVFPLLFGTVHTH